MSKQLKVEVELLYDPNDLKELQIVVLGSGPLSAQAVIDAVGDALLIEWGTLGKPDTDGAH